MGLVTVGVDVGQKVDPTAIVVCEAGSRPRPGHPKPEATFEGRHLERLALGVPYPAVGARVAEVARGALERMAAKRPCEEATLIVVCDATGVGAPVVDILRQALVGTPAKLTAATFTHGDRLEGRLGSRELRVGKAYLVSRLQALLQTDRMALPPDHPEAAALARELLDYEIRVDEDANDKYGAFKVGSHDDLVTALGLAVLTDPRPRPQGGTFRWT